MARKLFVSLEDDLETPEVVAEETVTVAENDAEAAVAVINETVEDIKEDVETIEEAASDIETLEDHTEVVEESLAEDGEGITEEHAKTLDIAVEHILKKLNYPKYKNLSVENFGSVHSRKQATKIALEGFKETIVQLWEKLKAVAKQMWEKVVEFYNKYFTEVGRLKNGIVALEKQVKEAKGSPKEATLKASGLTKAFWDFNAKEVKPEQIIANHIEVTKAGLQFADGIVPLAEEILNVVKKDAEGSIGGVVDKSSALLKGLLQGKEEAGPFFNGARFKLIGVDAGAQASGGLVGAGLGFAIEYVPFSGDKAPTALDKAGCEKVLSEAKELLALTEKFKEKQVKIKTFQAAITKVADTVISAANKMSEGDDKTKKETTTEIRTFINKSNVTYSRVLTTIPGLNTNVIKAAMNYVQASLRNMGEAATEKKPEEKTKA